MGKGMDRIGWCLMALAFVLCIVVPSCARPEANAGQAPTARESYEATFEQVPFMRIVGRGRGTLHVYEVEWRGRYCLANSEGGIFCGPEP